MARILITSGPTRQYLDPVRYITNASSGLMGACLAKAALAAGHEVTVVSGPVNVEYPPAATVIQALTTDEMVQHVTQRFADFDGLIGAAAPCDYMPRRVSQEKLAKDGQPLLLELIETPDVVASAAKLKRDDQWVVGFALETNDHRFRAIVKMQKKCCDMMVSNGPAAIDAQTNEVEILASDGSTIAHASGEKVEVAVVILQAIDGMIAHRQKPSLNP